MRRIVSHDNPDWKPSRHSFSNSVTAIEHRATPLGVVVGRVVGGRCAPATASVSVVAEHQIVHPATASDRVDDGSFRFPSEPCCAELDRWVKIEAMDLDYPPEAETFRVEIRAWLETNLPAGWTDDDFEMTDDEREAFVVDWTAKLFQGGWICASWPTEYGGKGLSTMESVVLSEEFARVGAPMRGDFFGDTLVGPTILQWGTEEQKKEFLPGILQARSPGARATPSPTPVPTWRRCSARPCSTATSG